MPIVGVLAAAMPEVIPALALLMVAWALSILLIRPVAWLLGNIPVVGGHIANALYSGASAVTSWAVNLARSGVDAMIQLVSAPVARLVDFVTALVLTVETAGERIGDLARNLTVTAGALWAEANALSARIANALAATAALAAAVPGLVAEGARAVVAAALAPVQAAVAALQRALAAGLAAEAAARLAGQSQLAATVAGVQAAAAAALAGAIAAERAQTQAALATVATDVAQVGASVKPVALATATALVAPVAAELSRLTRECIEPTCSVISPQLDTLQALLTGELVILAGLFLEEAIRDPEGTAREVAGAVDTVYRDAVGVFDLVTGAAL